MSSFSFRAIRPPLPREHGAWAMFAAPLLLGISVAAKWNVEVVLFTIVAFGFFLLRYPLMLAIKSRAPQARIDALRWSAIYGAITCIGGGVLLIATQLVWLIPLGALGLGSLAIYLWLASRREEMTAMGEWIGIAGLALGAPGAYLVATHSLNVTALILYLLNVLYFGGTVFYIKYLVREKQRVVTATSKLSMRLWAGRFTVAYHAMVVFIVAGFALIGWLPVLITIAFALPLCKVVGGVLTRPAKPNLLRIGFVEIVFTTAFALIVLLAYH